MDIDKIKQRILDLAIRGKLVSQDPNDEPTSVLIEKIKAEKEKMIKEGKIKPSKDDSYIYKASDNCYYENGNKIIFKEPLDVSNNIVWVKGKSILLKMEKELPKGTFFQYIDIDSIDNKTNIINKKMLSVDQAPSRASRKVFKESTLFSMVRPYLRNIAFVGEQNENAIASTGFYVCTPINGIHPKYLFLLLTSDYVVNELNEHMKGDNSPSIRSSDVENFWFPIPSYSYQIKVLSLLDKINLRIDEITRNEFEFKKLCHTFESKILDYFFGENSSYMSYYEKKPLQLVKLSQICDLNTGDSINKEVKSKKYTGLIDGTPYIGTKDVDINHQINYKNGVLIPDSELINFKIAQNGSILLCIEGGNAGKKIAITYKDVCFGNKLCCFTPKFVFNEYLFYYLQSSEFNEAFKNKTSGLIGGVGINKLRNIEIYLPCKEEQIKVVQSIKMVFNLIDKLY